MIEQMAERGRFIYALPTEEAREHLEKVLTGFGFAECEQDAEGRAAKWGIPGDDAAQLTALEREDLEVTLVEASGSRSVEALAALLDKTGFYAQSALLASAYDVGSEDSRKALTTLSHMVVAWDPDWADLFLLHLASPDPVARHDAVAALAIAAMVARDKGPAPELLAEAARRES